MTSRKRRLGTTDLDITTVGFGAWALGGGLDRGSGPVARSWKGAA
jgi:aryl-alcohol dehydrogenase-like predicted oxidoreductase